ncbi:variable surface lipoprotein [Mycoplasma phocoeninasale]|uniref:variable surface lipoprotein n=1 Tax=Mycoplasma phocoeninasale TaxID=2726117 RepID=UPI001967A9A5|nr:variable surface lipoprotein [Mycoplasma phocoeninasale]MBN0970642.1 variable surface lipoprotein [Mycoplasma phocoeninasale]
MKKSTKLMISLGSISSIIAIPLVAASCSNTDNGGEQQKIKENTNQTLKYEDYGITKLPESQIKSRVLIHPAARDANKLDAEGVFKFKLHLAPTQGVKGTWVGIATEVKSLNDNTLADSKAVKVTETEADEQADPNEGFPLIFKWDKQKLDEGKFYTFVFWKKDGTERIVFDQKYINSNQDTFVAEKARETNQTIDFTKHGVKSFPEQRVKTRTLIHPAARDANKLDAAGVFKFKLHLEPTRGVKGKWLGFATEVKSLEDNTLAPSKSVKVATTTADEQADPNEGFPLIFKWTDNNKLEKGKFYTFIFWKEDGSEKIVFSDENIKGSKDTFIAEEGRRTNQTIDFTEHGIKSFPEERVKTRTLLHPAARAENKLDADGVFKFSLHLAPVRGVTGEWAAFATEVEAENNNTLKLQANKPIIKKTTTIAKTNEEFPLVFEWKTEKLDKKKVYTFIFWKTDGTEKIVFSDVNIKGSKDTFPL